jgi:hypothetical protein
MRGILVGLGHVGVPPGGAGVLDLACFFGLVFCALGARVAGFAGVLGLVPLPLFLGPELCLPLTGALMAPPGLALLAVAVSLDLLGHFDATCPS